jgi:hypothetical protein
MDLALRVKRLEEKMESQTRKPSVKAHKLGALLGAYMALPGMRGFWPLSSMDANNGPQDVSGQARHLTNNGAATLGTEDDLVPVVTLNGSTQYLSRASESGLTITGALTALAWVKFNALGTAGVTNRPVMGKSPSTYAWWFGVDANVSGAMTFQVSSNGTALIGVTTPSGVIELGKWYFLAMRYTPSTEIKGWVMEAPYALTSGVPASMANNAGAVEIGRFVSGQYLNGSVALPWLGAMAVPDKAIERVLDAGRGLFGR